MTENVIQASQELEKLINRYIRQPTDNIKAAIELKRKELYKIMEGDKNMKSTGIVRPLDPLGRVVIPMELRRTMKLDSSSSFEIFVDGEMIVLRKYQPTCGVCKESDDLVESLAKYGIKVCKACAAEAIKE